MAGESNPASASRIPRAASRSLRGLPPGHLPPLRAPTLATREPPRLRPPQPRLPARTSAGRSQETLVPRLRLVPRLSPIRRLCRSTKISHPCFPPKVFPSADNFLLRFSGSARERTLFLASRQFGIPITACQRFWLPAPNSRILHGFGRARRPPHPRFTRMKNRTCAPHHIAGCLSSQRRLTRAPIWSPS